MDFVSERRSGLRPMPAVRRTLRRRWRRHFDDDVVGVGVDSDVDVVELPDEGADVVSAARWGRTAVRDFQAGDGRHQFETLPCKSYV